MMHLWWTKSSCRWKMFQRRKPTLCYVTTEAFLVPTTSPSISYRHDWLGSHWPHISFFPLTLYIIPECLSFPPLYDVSKIEPDRWDSPSRIPRSLHTHLYYVSKEVTPDGRDCRYCCRCYNSVLINWIVWKCEFMLVGWLMYMGFFLGEWEWSG